MLIFEGQCAALPAVTPWIVDASLKSEVCTIADKAVEAMKLETSS
jgi:hypothetical protein